MTIGQGIHWTDGIYEGPTTFPVGLECNAMTQWLLNVLFGTVLRAIADAKGEIMGAIEDFSASLTTTLGTISAGLANIDSDVTSLQNQIEALSNSLGTLTPEQKAMLDDITATVSGIATTVDNIDTRTPPV